MLTVLSALAGLQPLHAQPLDADRPNVAMRPERSDYRQSLARMMLEDAQQWADRAMYDSARRLVERARGMRVEWSDDELDPEQLLDEIDRLQFGNDESSTAASDVEQAPPRFTDLKKGEVDDSRRSGLSTGFIPLPPEYFRQATSSKPVPIQITTTDDALSRTDILLLLIGSMVGGAILIGGLHVVLSRFETSLKDVRVELVHRGEGRVFTSTETPPQEPRAAIESAASPDQPVATEQPNDPPPPHPSPDHDPPKEDRPATTPVRDIQDTDHLLTSNLETVIHTIAEAGTETPHVVPPNTTGLGLIEQVVQTNLELRDQLVANS